MRKHLLLVIILILSITPIITSSQEMEEECNFVGLLDAWAGATAEGMPNGAVFGYLVNLGTEMDTLLSASSDVAEAVEVHETVMGEDDVMSMQHLPDGLMVKPHNYVQLKRGSYHIMLIGLLEPLEDGSSFDVTLVFENAGEVVVTVAVHDMAHMDMMGGMEHDEDESMAMHHEDEMEKMPMMVDEACMGVHVLGAWARPGGMAMPNSAAYGLLVNLGEEDVTLVSAETGVAEAVELHEMTMGDNDVMQMSMIEGGIVVPAGGVAQLQPGGLHVMLIGVAEPMEVDTTITLTLTFDDETVMELEVPVQEPMEDGMSMMNH